MKSLDPKRYVLSSEEIAALKELPAKLPSSRKSKHEIQFYQFPTAMVNVLVRTDYAPAWRLAAAVYKGWYKGYKNPNPVKLTSALLTEFRISKDQEWKALKILEQSGLFLVERFPGRSPLVMMKWKLVKD
jgi:hypothetical protein